MEGKESTSIDAVPEKLDGGNEQAEAEDEVPSVNYCSVKEELLTKEKQSISSTTVSETEIDKQNSNTNCSKNEPKLLDFITRAPHKLQATDEEDNDKPEVGIQTSHAPSNGIGSSLVSSHNSGERNEPVPEVHKQESSLVENKQEDAPNPTDLKEEEMATSNFSAQAEDTVTAANTSLHPAAEPGPESGPDPGQSLHCNECNVTYRSTLSFEVHRRWHSVDRPYRCDLCKVSFERSTALQAHLQWHELQRPFVCEQCNLAFTQAWTLTQHMKKHAKPTYQCSICRNRYVRRSELRAHERRHTEYPYECDVCDALYTVRYYLKIHMQKHTRRRPWKCPCCKAIFVERTSMDVHREMKHPNTFIH